MAMARGLHTNFSMDDPTVTSLNLSSSASNSLEQINEAMKLKSGSESDLNLAMYNERSNLMIDTNLYHIGSGEVVKISWNVQEEISPMDWVALSRISEENPNGEVMDYKSRGVSGERTGYLEWRIDDLQHYFNVGETMICFKYFHGPTGTLRAVSSSLKVMKSALSFREEEQLFQVFFTDIHAQYLKKGMFFSPDPFVRITVSRGRHSSTTNGSNADIDPNHYNQVAKTTVISSTTNPYWRNEEFILIVTENDYIEFEVKHMFMKKSASLSKVLGHLSVPVQKLMSKQQLGVNTITANLMRKQPSNDNMSGVLAFTFDLLSGHSEHRRSLVHSSFPSKKALEAQPAAQEKRNFSTLPRGFRQRKGVTSSLAEVTTIPCTTGHLNENARSENEWDISVDEETAASFVVGSNGSEVVSSPEERNHVGSIETAENADDTASYDDPANRSEEEASGIEELPISENNPCGEVLPDTLLELGTVEFDDRASALEDTQNNHNRTGIGDGLQETQGEPESVSNHSSTSDETGLPEDRPQAEVTLAQDEHPETPDDVVGAPENDLIVSEVQNGAVVGVDSIDIALEPEELAQVETDYDDTDQIATETQEHPGNNDTEAESAVEEVIGDSDPALLGATAAEITEPVQPVNPLGRQLRSLEFIESEVAENSYAAVLQRRLQAATEEGATNLEREVLFRPAPPTEPPTDDVVIVPHASSSRRSASVRPNTNNTEMIRAKVSRIPSMMNARDMYRRDDSINDGTLPSGWEAAVDIHGRVFYIDHANKKTTWHKPTESTVSVARVNTIRVEARQNLEQRYNTVQRAAASAVSDSSMQQSSTSSHSLPEGTDEDAPPPAMPQRSASKEKKLRKSTHSRTERMDISLLMKMPSVQFLTRPDLKTFLQDHSTAWAVFEDSNSIKHMISRVRRDPQAFLRYRHNRELVNFLNLFADDATPLPDKWDQKMDNLGKKFFIDHNSRSTTFVDPRLPVESTAVHPAKKTNPARTFVNTQTPDTVATFQTTPPVSRVPTSYNEKVVAYFKQPNLFELIKSKHSASGALKEKIRRIQNEGVAALKLLSNDVELIIVLSLFEQEISSFGSASPGPASPHHSPAMLRRTQPQEKRDFQAKLAYFYKKLHQKGYAQGPGKLKLVVRREHVLEDAYNKIMGATKKELQRSKLVIHFQGEEGLDYGGPGKEFFFLLSQELFNPYYGLFEYSANDTYTVQLSPMSTFVDNYQDWFRFAGRVLGLAVVNQFLLDAFFTRPFYKMLLKIPWSLSDLESLDAEFHQSLLWIKENDITDVGLDLTFSVDEEIFGQLNERDLKHNGRNIPVTEKNKREYIDRIVNWRIERGVHEQCEFLLRGFYEVIDHRMIGTFDASELELVIAGVAEIDIHDWRKNTEYRSGYHDKHPVVQLFWMAVERFDNERRLRLLQFVTGSSSVPYEGFSALRGSNGPRKFCVEKWGKPGSLPRAHTCFNRIDLPAYSSFEVLFDKLITAIEETNTFSIE